MGFNPDSPLRPDLNALKARMNIDLCASNWSYGVNGGSEREFYTAFEHVEGGTAFEHATILI